MCLEIQLHRNDFRSILEYFYTVKFNFLALIESAKPFFIAKSELNIKPHYIVIKKFDVVQHIFRGSLAIPKLFVFNSILWLLSRAI